MSSQVYKKHKEVKGYKILDEYSTHDRTAYLGKDNKVIYAFRGTGIKGARSYSDMARDLGTDTLMAFEMHGRSSRLENALLHTKRLTEKYGKENVTLTGHSLGGSQALWVSRHLGVNAEVYNPYISPGQSKFFYRHATIHHTLGDWISAGSVFTRAKSKRYHVAKAYKDPHALDSTE